ncbi:hypothetical protein EVAR_60968_1 [Eumeta japonica]|uniref:Uncharacterized protein n=1 Tax=Eumeta variegata TaxID=151549 RepID=A0A4C1XSP2_EUMVA|nr:hypothetical protein EVAR_60968_1 [Eumeta japonica]
MIAVQKARTGRSGGGGARAACTSAAAGPRPARARPGSVLITSDDGRTRPDNKLSARCALVSTGPAERRTALIVLAHSQQPLSYAPSVLLLSLYLLENYSVSPTSIQIQYVA